jgi:hypothetical protein
VTRRHVPDTGDTIGFVGLLFLAILLTMALAMCDGSFRPQGFAP